MKANTPVRVLRAPVSRFAGIPVPYQPRDRAMTLVAALQRLEGLQELMLAKLIAELDALEAPTFDLEDDEREIEDDEHNLGWENPSSQMRMCAGSNDLEPSLGSLGGCVNAQNYDQRRWARGSTDDLEEEHDGSEDGADEELVLGWSESESELGKVSYAFPKDDDEPSLGSGNSTDQAHWAPEHQPQTWLVIDGEDECNDEGFDADSEPEEADDCVEYAEGGIDQRRIVKGRYGGRVFYTAVGERGA